MFRLLEGSVFGVELIFALDIEFVNGLSHSLRFCNVTYITEKKKKTHEMHTQKKEK